MSARSMPGLAPMCVFFQTLLVLILGLCGGSEATVLNGHVLINGSQPAGKALVRVRNVDSKYTAVTISDDNGQYSMPDAPEGTYILEVEADGLLAFRESLTLVGMTFLKNIDLTTTDRAAFIEVQILVAEDDAIVLIDSVQVMNWRRDGTNLNRIALSPGLHRFEVRVYNQRSFTGGLEMFGGRRPEGWRYCLRLGTRNNPKLKHQCDDEEQPDKDGPRHGKEFVVLTAEIVVVGETGEVTIRNWDPEAWRRP
jgi:Carboxypeptidase regulatory-like domain